MCKGVMAAVVMAGAMWAGQANATVMSAQLFGDFNDNPYWLSWSAELIYDTDFGTLTTTPDGNTLTWSLADGGPSPLQSVQIKVNPRTLPLVGGRQCTVPNPTDPYCTLPPTRVDLFETDFTSFTIIRTLEDYTWTASAATAFGFKLGVEIPGPHNHGLNDPIGTDLSLDAAYARGSNYSGYYGSWSLGLPPSPFGMASMPYTNRMSVAPVPEPATWAMLLLGFFGLGALVRQRRPEAAC